MNDEILQDVDLENNDVVSEETVDSPVDDTDSELEELRKFKAEIEKKEAIKRRLATKQAKTATTNNTKSNIDEELAKDIAEFKFERRVVRFAEEQGITQTQARYLFELKPNATADDLKNEFIKAGLDAVSKKTRIAQNTPRGKNAVSSAPKKALSEMTPAEKQAWYAS